MDLPLYRRYSSACRHAYAAHKRILADADREHAEDLPDLPLLWRLSHVSIEDYGQRFKNALLRAFFCAGATGNLSALALVMSLAWMSSRNAGYAIGGSQAIVRALSNDLSLSAVTCVTGRGWTNFVENDVATGVRLESGEIIRADWVCRQPMFTPRFVTCSAASLPTQPSTRRSPTMRPSRPTCRSRLVWHDNLSREPGYLTLVLNDAIEVDPETSLRALSFRIFNFDPTFAPSGKTAVACFLPNS